MTAIARPSWFRRIVNRLLTVSAAVALTLAFFLVLPVMQRISETLKADVILQPTDVAEIEPPAEIQQEEEEPEPEPEKNEPKLEAQQTPLASLAEMDIAMNAGSGGGAAMALKVDFGQMAQAAGGGDDPFRMDELDQKPRATYQPSPKLTHQMRARTPATVYVIFVVDERGRVTQPRIEQSSDPLFDQPTLKAIERWRFEPGQRGVGPCGSGCACPSRTRATTHDDHDRHPRTEFPRSLLAVPALLLLLATLVGGCTLSVDGKPVVQTSDWFWEKDNQPTTQPTSQPAIEKTQLPESELAVWKSPDFRRRFTESYIAETDVEPKLSEPEREQMQKILELLGENKVDQAAALCLKYGGERSSAVFDYTLGNIHYERKEYDKAAAEYRKAVAKHPKYLRAWRNLGLLEARQNRQAEALKALTRVVELGGGDAAIYGLMGYAYTTLEQDVSAESAYRMAILMDPVTLDWKKGLAMSFFRQKRFAEAAAMCDQLLKEDPDRAEIWMLQANAYIGMKRPLDAAENYEMVDKLHKSTASTLTMLGDIYINEELYEMAVSSYARALKMKPNAKDADEWKRTQERAIGRRRCWRPAARRTRRKSSSARFTPNATRTSRTPTARRCCGSRPASPWPRAPTTSRPRPSKRSSSSTRWTARRCCCWAVITRTATRTGRSSSTSGPARSRSSNATPASRRRSS